MSRSDRVYGHVAGNIFAGRWEPGERVSAYALAAELEVSRTPVIEALKRLESEGLVEIIPKVGCRITAQSPSTLAELVAIRGALEGLAAEAAATRIEVSGLTLLDELLAGLELAAGSGQQSVYAELRHRLHGVVLDASRLRHVAVAVGPASSLLRLRSVQVHLSPEHLQALIVHDRAVVEALRERAPALARAAAQRHAASLGVALGARTWTAEEPSGLSHQALVYSSEDEFLAATVPFVLEGLERGERVLAVTSIGNVAILQRALGTDADVVDFADAVEWYIDPATTLRTYQQYVDAHRAGGRVRVIGEPVWGGLGGERVQAWTRYESLLNVAFAISPVSIMCPYDASALSPAIVHAAHCTHPEICTAGTVSPSSDYVQPLAPDASEPPRDQRSTSSRRPARSRESWMK